MPNQALISASDVSRLVSPQVLHWSTLDDGEKETDGKELEEVLQSRRASVE